MGSMRPTPSSTVKRPTASPKTGQTICNVTDAKIIKLFVDDEPFWLPDANLLSYDRRLNMKSGTLDREILWETPAGKQVRITSRRLVSFADRHVAAISYRVTLAQRRCATRHLIRDGGESARAYSTDPKTRGRRRVAAGPVLHPRASYANDRRIVLCHATEKSRLTLTCATDHALETSCTHTYKTVPHRGLWSGCLHDRSPALAVQFTSPNTWSITRPRQPRPQELCGRAEWTMDRIMTQGFQDAAHCPRAVSGRFLAPQRCPYQGCQGGAHEAHHRGDPTSDPLQPLSNPAGLRACGRRRCAS